MRVFSTCSILDFRDAPFSIYEELTDAVCADVVCVSEVGSCAIADLNVLELMA
jgi:hypothetical protein